MNRTGRNAQHGQTTCKYGNSRWEEWPSGRAGSRPAGKVAGPVCGTFLLYSLFELFQINLAIAWFVTDFRASPPEVSPLASNIHIEELGPEIPALSHSPNSAISGRPTPSAERTLQRLFSEYGKKCPINQIGEIL